MKKLFIPLLLLVMLFSGCSNQTETKPEADQEQKPIQEEKVKSLSIQEYFPNKPGTIRQYKSFDENGKVVRKDYEVLSSHGSTKLVSPEELAEFVIVRSSELYKPKTSVQESNDYYEVKDNKITRSPAGGDSEQTSENTELLLTNQPSWELNSGATRTITAINKTITTKAGEFTNCIETTDSLNARNHMLKSYFAPGKGLVLEKTQTKENGAFTVSKELTNFQLPEQADNSGQEEAADSNQAEETQEESSQSNQQQSDKTLLYHNETHGFYLDIPSQWRGHYLVEETKDGEEITINFRFKSEDNLYIDTIMYIIISGKSKEEIEQENANSGFPLSYLTSHNGKSYSYLYNVGDPSIELINAQEDLNLLIELKQQVPKVMKTMRFEP